MNKFLLSDMEKRHSVIKNVAKHLDVIKVAEMV